MESSVKIENNKLQNIGQLKKISHDYFSFYINFSQTEENSSQINFINEFLLLPKLPILAKYNRNNYEMSEVLSLVTFDYDLHQNSESENIFNLPKEILEYLNKTLTNSLLNKKVENNTKNSKLDLDKQISNCNTIIKFYWLCIENILNKENSRIYNILPHLFLFDELNFSNTKRIFMNYPICMYLTDAIENSSGIQEYFEDSHNLYNHNLKSGINLNNLRIEYSSIHMIKDSLGFSPNNLKLYLDTNTVIAHFYLIILKDNTFHVFYYWILNEKSVKNSIKEIFEVSPNLKQLIENLANSKYAKEKFVINLNNIFKI